MHLEYRFVVIQKNTFLFLASLSSHLHTSEDACNMLHEFLIKKAGMERHKGFSLLKRSGSLHAKRHEN